MLGCAEKLEAFGTVRDPSFVSRRRSAFSAGEVVGGDRRGRSAQLLRRAEEHDLAAALARSRPDIEDPVGSEHDLRIVLDDDQRIARVPQPVHHADDASDVARMQADRRLVEHEQRVHERGAQRGGQVDPLHFAAGERTRLAVERQVRQPDVREITDAGANLGQQQLGRLVERRGKRQPRKERPRRLDRQQREIVQCEAGQLREHVIAESNAMRAEPRRRIEHAIGVVFRAEPP